MSRSGNEITYTTGIFASARLRPFFNHKSSKQNEQIQTKSERHLYKLFNFHC